VVESDPRLVHVASTSPNFGALESIEPILAVYGAGAESSIHSDPNDALVRCRQFGEHDGERQIDRGP